jgi:hypothetical protein
MMTYMQEAMSMGINNPQHRWNYGLAHVQRDYAASELQRVRQSPAATPPPAPQPNAREEANKRFVNQNNGIVPSRGNSVPAPSVPEGKPNLARMLQEVMRANGE